MNSVDKATLFNTMGLGPVWELKTRHDTVQPAAVMADSPALAQGQHAHVQRAEPGTALMVLGCAPGIEDNEADVPFAGAQGELLARMLSAIDLNVAKHAGLFQSTKADQVKSCLPVLMAQMNEQQPKVLLVLGKHAANAVLNCEDSIEDLRAKVHSLDLNTQAVQVVVTHDLEHLFKRPEDKAKVWEDLLKLKRLLV